MICGAYRSGEKNSYDASQEALRGDHFSLVLKLAVVQKSFELAIDGGIKIRSANSHFVLNNHN